MFERVATILEMIKFEHSIFALPFAFMGAFLAAEGFPDWAVCGWILLAMVSARSAAMAFNRLVDVRYDATNPRTNMRALVTGSLRKREVVLFTIVSAALFVLAAAMLNTFALAAALPLLAFLFLYSYTKRFTILAHFVLGFCLGFALTGGWIAVTGSVSPIALYLGLGVSFWVSGFDLIYACQDVDHDRNEGLHSLPARFSIRAALVLSGFMHVAAFGVFCAVGILAELEWPFWAGLGVVLVSLVWQHAIVRPGDLSRVNAAFFTANGIISVVMAVGTLGAFLV